MILRDYQTEAIEKVMCSWQKEPSGSELLILATGAGKTIIFSEIARRLAEQGILTLILAHRDDLLDQAIEKYHNIKPEAIVGKVKGSINELGGEVTVASVASARSPKRIKQMQQFNYGLIVVDEAHHVAAASYQTVLQAFPNAFVLYVTATPDRLDNKPIIEKSALYTKGIIDLVKMGYLCTPRAIAIRTDVSLDEIKTTAGDFNERELSDAVDTPARNKRIVDAYQEHAANMPAIAFCVTVQHAESLAYTFNDFGIPANVVTGKTSADDRKQMYSDLRNGVIKVLVSIQVLTEGFDEPCVSCIIMARPTKSRALYVQCVGRGARLFPDKEHFLVLDITDNCKRHRLEPHNLNKALGLKLQDGETIEEAEERERQVRRLKERRKEDEVIILLQEFDWRKRESDGAFILEFGKGHRMALKPEHTDKWNPFDIPEYSVWARLAGAADIQKWSSVNMPLVEALQFAEARVLKIQDEPYAVKLFDANATWRNQPVDPSSKQAEMAGWMRIEITEGMTKGQLSALIDQKKREREERKQQRKLSPVKR